MEQSPERPLVWIGDRIKLYRWPPDSNPDKQSFRVELTINEGKQPPIILESLPEAVEEMLRRNKWGHRDIPCMKTI